MNNSPFQPRGYDSSPIVMTLATALRSGDTELRINPAKINIVKTHASGAEVWYQEGVHGQYTSAIVTETPSAILALGLPLVEVADVLTPTETVWIPVGNISEVQIADAGASSFIYVNLDKNGNASQRKVAVAPSVFIAAMDAAMTAVSPTSQIQVIAAAGTTQGTATLITSSSVTITSGAADTGAILPEGALIGEIFITNQSGSEKFIYPASGENFEGLGADFPQSIPDGESMNLKYASTEWVAEDSEFMQKVAASGTVQGGGQIKANVATAYITSVTPMFHTAVTLPEAKAGTKITIHQLATVTAQLFPSGTDQIYGLGAGVKTPVALGQSINLQCTVNGSWEDEVSQIETLVVNNIKSTATGGVVKIQDLTGTDRVYFNQNNTEFFVGVNLHNISVEATTVPATVNGTLIRITTCATEGDGIILGAAHNNLVKVVNSGVATAFIYPPAGLLMNGVVDGYLPITRGGVAEFITDESGGWVGTLINTALAHEVVATGAGATILNPKATITTVTTPRDKVVLNPNFLVQTVVNSGANAAEVVTPAGEFINGPANTFALVQPGSINQFVRSANGQWTYSTLSGIPQSAVASIATPPVLTAKNVLVTTTGAGEAAVLGDNVANSGTSFVGEMTLTNVSANAFDLTAAFGSGFVDSAVGGAAAATFVIAANTTYKITLDLANTQYMITDIG